MESGEACVKLYDRESEDRPRTVVSEVIELKGFRSAEPRAVRMALYPGVISGYGTHKGNPDFYHVVEDAPDHGFREDSLTSMVRKILGDASLSLRADPSNNPETLLEQAETLKARMEDPEVQKLIRSLFEQRERLRKMLGIR